MRLTSEIWVSALIRRAAAETAAAAVIHRGDATAGAVFVSVDRLDGSCDLYGPSPQAAVAEDDGDRRFERLLTRVERPAMLARIASERRFDADLWLVEIEDRDGRSFILPPPIDPTAPVPPAPEWPPIDR
jgi:hypothetical protein